MFTGKKLIMVDFALIISLVFAFTVGGLITKYKSNNANTQPFEYRDCFDNKNIL